MSTVKTLDLVSNLHFLQHSELLRVVIISTVTRYTDRQQLGWEAETNNLKPFWPATLLASECHDGPS